MHIEGDFLILPQYYREKKITATSFYGLLGGNKFKPKGDYLLSVLGLLKEQIDPFYTQRGEIAEELVNSWLKTRGFTTKTWDRYEIGFDNFKQHSKLGGMIDIAITSPSRTVVECKSKNIKDEQKIKKFPNQEQEHQALFYGYMSKCKDVKLIYVFFTDEQEHLIRNYQDIDMQLSNFKFYEKELQVDFEDIRKKLAQAIAYKEQCMEEGRIPLCDISDKALDLLGLKK